MRFLELQVPSTEFPAGCYNYVLYHNVGSAKI